ncbi:Putative 2,3-dihydroxypropane-1-sulfonate exporter [Pantoea sp. Nvir]|uniref:MFS transporter n=1 Tax=unclassified Pantoea TaxID=2630326 RepID=UPI001EF412BB|nr:MULTISPECIES: MFS transporter [unclassified Pantoea]MCG7365585.1 MFS transporter [Pantoea sp. ACRSH]MCG7396198.1 MFS transporter [Pantoea sp. ACRSC]
MQQTANPATLRLPFKEKLAYGMGDLGSNILLDIGTLYLLKFYTDVLGLPGTYGGIIFLIAKFFTAFTDMGTGIMLDARRNTGAKGKFRPFILYAAFPVTLLAIANFVGTPFEIAGKTVVATVLFMLYGLFFSMMNCSYGAIVPAMTKNPDERAALAAWRQGGATLGLLLCTVGFVPVMNLIDGNPPLGYIFAATLFSLFGLLFMWWCYAGVKERYVEVKPLDGGQKPGLLQSFRAIAGNRPLFILCIANLCTLGAFNIKLAIQVYYTQYVLNDPALLSWMGFFSMGCIFIGVFLMPGMVRRFGKKTVYLSGLMIWVAGDLLNYFSDGGSVSFVLFSCLAFFGSAFVNSLNWALVSDTVEYGEWRTGVRSEGTVYTGFTFFRKVSQALAGFFPGWMLTQIGYLPNVVQSAGTVEGLRQLIFLYPCALAVITIVAMGCFYNLNEKMYVRIVEEIETRKQTA